LTVVELFRRKSPQAYYNIAPFVYQFYPNYDYPTWAEFWTDTFGVTQTQSNIRLFVKGFYRNPNVLYDKETSVANVMTTEQSWYWDHETQICTVHLEHDASIYNDTFSYYWADGFTDFEGGVYIDDIFYLGVLQSSPKINQSMDLQNYSIPSYITGSVELYNPIDNTSTTGKHRLDALLTEPIYGNGIDIYYLEEDPDATEYTRTNLVPQASLYVEKPDFTINKIILSVQDKRISENATIPTARFSATDYADLEDGYIGKVIPVLWGTPACIPAICTNGNATSGNVEYRAAILLTAIGTVQVDTTGNGNWSTVTPSAISLATGSFTLSAGDGRDDDGKYLACRILAPTGISITRLSDVIIDANERYLDRPYTATYYDLTEWAAEETAISSGAVYLSDERKLADLIVDIQNKSNVGFRYEINAEGLRTIRIDDESRTPIGTIQNLEILNRDELPVENDPSILAAEILIGYNKNYSDGTFPNIVFNDNAEEILNTYQQRPQYPADGPLDTFLTSEANANSKAEYIDERSSSVRGIVGTMLRNYLSLRLLDIYYAQLTPAGFIDGTTITGREYLGIRKIKIIEVEPDNRAKTNSIKAVIID
jgi:hypothetical protein